MVALKDFCKAHEHFLVLLLLCLSVGFYSLHITAPLADYDEATYAKVTVDTLSSGNIFHLTLLGEPWFEKPPLYFWLSMSAVKVLGEHEFAFRLPGILASIVCLFLIYLITKELTGDVLSAGIAFLVLLFTPLFYIYAIRGHLDSSVIMCMLGILYFWIRGWSVQKHLLWLFPLAATGFLYKSVIIFLAAPILLIFSACFAQWSWLKNRYLWLGLIPSLLIIVPWHLLETIRFGASFWQTYFVWNVFQRATTRITGTSGYGDFVSGIFESSPLWAWVILALVAVYLGMWIRARGHAKATTYRHVLGPLGTALFILGFFSLMSSQLPFYIMPMFPFIALFVGMLFHDLTERQGIFPYIASLLVSCLVVLGVYYFGTPAFRVPNWSTPDEAAAGKLYRAQEVRAPLYAIGWPNLETLNYYAGTRTIYREPELTPEALIKGPFYVVMATANLPIIFYKDANNTWKCKYGDLTILYQGPELMLLYSSGDYPQL